MNLWGKALLSICLLAVVSCSNGQDGARLALAEKISTLIETLRVETGTPAFTVHVQSPTYGEMSFSAGMADLAEQTPVLRTQSFRIGSLTKSFTAAAVLKLVEAGLVDLDAPISDYLGLVNGYAPLAEISVRQLMNMSSGLAPCLDLPFLTGSVLTDPTRAYPPTTLLKRAFDNAPQLLFTPGDRFQYNNTNYLLLGMLIEAVAETNYKDFLERNFIGPLGMRDTFVALDTAVPADLVHGYFDTDEDGVYEDWTNMHMSFVWSAGCLISTARDVAVWMEYLASGELFSAAVRSELYRGQPVAEGVIYSAGLLVADNFAIGHNGAVIGYHADAWHDPRTGVTVAVLSNTNVPLLDDERDPTKELATGILALFER